MRMPRTSHSGQTRLKILLFYLLPVLVASAPAPFLFCIFCRTDLKTGGMAVSAHRVQIIKHKNGTGKPMPFSVELQGLEP